MSENESVLSLMKDWNWNNEKPPLGNFFLPLIKEQTAENPNPLRSISVSLKSKNQTILSGLRKVQIIGSETESESGVGGVVQK